MIEIDGPLWFISALLIFCAHALYLRGWRRDRRDYMRWRERYNAIEERRHEEFMRAIGSDNAGWNLDGGRERGQA